MQEWLCTATKIISADENASDQHRQPVPAMRWAAAQDRVSVTSQYFNNSTEDTEACEEDPMLMGNGMNMDGGTSEDMLMSREQSNGDIEGRSNGSSSERKSNGTGSTTGSREAMTTGCIPCLILGVPCDPSNPRCRLALSSEWSANGDQDDYMDGTKTDDVSPASTNLSMVRIDTHWKRNWRERHSLNFFVQFSAPQMAGFFENAFWARCIQYSYQEPVILHAISAIGSLHESILRGAFLDEKTKAQAVEFALTQCNQSIAYLTGSKKAGLPVNGPSHTKGLPVSKLALIACVLFTCFESIQGHCDSAVRHALQGKSLMEAHHSPHPGRIGAEEDDIELLRPLVERLEVQATALVGKGDRPTTDETSSVPPLPTIDRIYNLDHAHVTLHTAMNSNMRYSQRFQPDAPADHHAITHAKKTMRYGPWYAQWEAAFSVWLLENGESLSNMDRKRAMVLKANQIVGTMLATADQRAGPAAYDRFDNEFRAIVDLSREVLADFSCPPLPTLTSGSAGTPYFSCSLWVTDPLWMAISRCRNAETRQAAFALLRQNPRQEGIWHAGPKSSSDLMRRVEKGHTSHELKGPKSAPSSNEESKTSTPDSGVDVQLGDVPKDVSGAAEAGNMRARSEWVDLMANSPSQDSGSEDVGG